MSGGAVMAVGRQGCGVPGVLSSLLGLSGLWAVRGVGLSGVLLWDFEPCQRLSGGSKHCQGCEKLKMLPGHLELSQVLSGHLRLS